MFSVSEIHKSMGKELNKIIEILPGLSACIIIAWLGKLTADYLPSIGAASAAIFIGMLAGNTALNNKIYAKGSKFAESTLLSYSIVLLGGTLGVKTILNIGPLGVIFIIFQMLITITAAILIGKRLGFSENYRLLMASGNAVCGSSAIAAVAPAIDADDGEKGIVITIVNVTGTILMILLPVLAKVLFEAQTVKTSALIGGILQSVGQVVASGSLVNENVRDLSTIFKIVRIIFLGFVVMSFGSMKKKTDTKAKMPWYVKGFFIMCALFTMGILSQHISSIFKMISGNLEIIALSGIGMRVNFRELIAQGFKASAYALGVSIAQIISAIMLITLLL